MRCLYCGKELALLKRLTGGGEFCSDAHKSSYQEEYNRLAISRLLQAQTKSDIQNKTAKPGPVAASPAAAESEPDPVREVVPAPALREPEPPPELPHLANAPEPAVEPELAPAPAIREPELVASDTFGFLLEIPAIQNSELFESDAVEPSEWPPNTQIPAFQTASPGPSQALAIAGLVGYDVRLEALASTQPGAAIVATSREFANAELSMKAYTKPRPLKGFRPAGAVPVAISFKSAPAAAGQGDMEITAPPFEAGFRETTRLESGVAGIAFPPEEADVVILESGAPLDAWLELDASPRSALEALAKLKEQVNGDSSRNGAAESGLDSQGDLDDEPASDDAVLQWAVNDSGMAPSRGPNGVPEPVREHQELLNSDRDAGLAIEPAAEVGELVGVASISGSATAVSELEPEPSEVREKIPQHGRFAVVPVKIFAPAKARLAPGSPALPTKPEPQLPRTEASPLRPKVAIGTAADISSKVEDAKPPVVSAKNESVAKAPSAGDAPSETPSKAKPVVAVRRSAGLAPPSSRGLKTIVRPPEPDTAETKKGSAPAASQKAPAKEPAAVSEAAKPEAKSNPSSKPGPETPVPPVDSEITVPGISFASGTSSSFWGALPTAVKIVLALVIVAIVGGVIYMTSFSSAKSQAGGHDGVSIMMGEGGWITDWAGDATGLHRGRQITIYRPSLKLSDYRIEFQGRVENASIGWVFRAVDSANYYVMKLTQTSSGFKLMKYAVINGQEHEQGSVAVAAPAAGWFAIRVDARGPKFNTVIDGQAIDMWTDDQLKSGGVGFLNDRGERADIKGISISYLAGPGK